MKEKLFTNIERNFLKNCSKNKYYCKKVFIKHGGKISNENTVKVLRSMEII